MDGKKPSFIGENHTLLDEVVIRGIKLIDISFVTTLYVILAFISSFLIDKITGEYDRQTLEEKSFSILLFKLFLNFSLISIFVYFTKNLIKQIPSPLHDVYGYNHWRLKELFNISSIFFAPIILATQWSKINILVSVIYKKMR